MIAVARTCSLIFIVLDVLKPLQHKKLIEHELEGFGIRLNKTPPNIGFRKKDKGGLNLTLQVRGMEEHFHPYQPPTVITLPLSQVPQSQLDLAQVRSILAEYRIHNADITLRCDATADDLIDVVEGNRSVCGEFKQVEHKWARDLLSLFYSTESIFRVSMYSTRLIRSQ